MRVSCLCVVCLSVFMYVYVCVFCSTGTDQKPFNPRSSIVHSLPMLPMIAALVVLASPSGVQESLTDSLHYRLRAKFRVPEQGKVRFVEAVHPVWYLLFGGIPSELMHLCHRETCWRFPLLSRKTHTIKRWLGLGGGGGGICPFQRDPFGIFTGKVEKQKTQHVHQSM